MHVYAFVCQQTTTKHTKLINMPAKTYAHTKCTHKRTSIHMQSKASWFKVYNLVEKGSSLDLLSVIRLDTYGMCFFPNSAGCPITWKCLLFSFCLCKTVNFSWRNNFRAPIFHIHKSLLRLPIALLSVILCSHTSKKGSNIFFYHIIEGKLNFKDEHCGVAEINLKCYDREAKNIICSLDLQCCF